MIYCLLHLYFVYAVYTPLIIETPEARKKRHSKRNSPFRVAPVKIRLSVAGLFIFIPALDSDIIDSHRTECMNEGTGQTCIS